MADPSLDLSALRPQVRMVRDRVSTAVTRPLAHDRSSRGTPKVKPLHNRNSNCVPACPVPSHLPATVTVFGISTSSDYWKEHLSSFGLDPVVSPGW